MILWFKVGFLKLRSASGNMAVTLLSCDHVVFGFDNFSCTSIHNNSLYKFLQKCLVL